MTDMLSTQRRGASFGELQSAAAAGQRWAIEALTQEFLTRLVSFARVRGASDPEGIAHVALVSVLRRLGDLHFDAREQLWAYLCRTARSRIIDEHRAAKPVDLVDDEATLHQLGVDSSGVGPTSFDDRVVNRDYVDGLLSPLTNEQRQVLEMRFLDDLSIEETASRTGRSQDAVKGLQRRAINAIIAAAAILLALVALRWAGGDDADRISNAPADQTPVAEESTPEEGAERLDGEQTAVVVSDGEPDQASGDSALVVDAEATPDATEAGPAEPVGVGPFVVTRGSTGSTEIDATGPTVPADLHGTRVYCAVSHFANGDPIAGPLDPGLNPANVYWGNTSAGAT